MFAFKSRGFCTQLLRFEWRLHGPKGISRPTTSVRNLRTLSFYPRRSSTTKSNFIALSRPTLQNMSSTSKSTSGVKLTVEPQSALVDDVIDIRVNNIPSLSDVTLVCVLDEGGKVYVSCGQYVSDVNGTVDVSHSISLDGTFTGVERMGLLWSMKPADDQPVGVRLMKPDVSTPFLVQLFVLEGHITITHPNQLEQAGVKCLAKTVIQRYYQDSKVRAIPVKDGKLRGMFFLPPGEGPFPGVIDMFGTSGDLTKFRAALLASRGFATLALPYFDYEDLPKHMTLDYQYFVDAVEWLYKQPMINRNSGGIGIVAVSKGATLALQTAVLSKKVKAVVSINAACVHNTGIHTYNGVPQPVFDPTSDDLERGFKNTKEGWTFGEAYKPTEANQDAIVPLRQLNTKTKEVGLHEIEVETGHHYLIRPTIEKAPHCKFLFIAAEDDPSTTYSNVTELIKRLLHHGLNNFRLLSYPGAGHLLEPPYTPHCRTAYAKIIGSPVLYGGTTKTHSIAQEDHWKETLRFINKELNLKIPKSKI